MNGFDKREGNESSSSAASEGGGVEKGMVMYKTKTIQFLGRSTPIILQNENGPCPLLAICNVLLLRNAIRLNPDVYEVSQEHLLALVANRLLESNSDTKDEEYVSNQHQNISDAIDLLPRLATGIDVNMHFRKINDFEFTRECAIFDLLDIGLYHGWIVDPEDKETVTAIGSKSYNMLVGEVVALETSPNGWCLFEGCATPVQLEGQLITNFLKVNASQLTIYGLFCLLDGLNERELCVFFRNNHFSTMFKFTELYLLATDQGYVNQPDLVWEKLNEVNGDTVFMTGEFTEFIVDNQADGTWDRENAISSTADYSTIKVSSQEGSATNADLQLAIALQEQEFELEPQLQPPPQHSQHT